MSLKSYRDDDGEFVRNGDFIRFSFGMPPVGVLAMVIDRDGSLIVLTPTSNPKECKLRSLRRFVGGFWKCEPSKSERASFRIAMMKSKAV